MFCSSVTTSQFRWNFKLMDAKEHTAAPKREHVKTEIHAANVPQHHGTHPPDRPGTSTNSCGCTLTPLSPPEDRRSRRSPQRPPRQEIPPTLTHWNVCSSRLLKHIFGCPRYNLLFITVAIGMQINLHGVQKRRTSIVSILRRKTFPECSLVK